MGTLNRRTALRGLGALAAWPLAGRAQAIPIVAAASDLKFALDQVHAQFSRETGHKVNLVFGSSGNFYAQLLHDAPYEMFMSADEDFVFKLADAGKTRDRGRIYGFGRLVIIVPHGSSLKADAEMGDLAAALKDGRLRKFAIANPEHAPYGRRAQEALRHAGLWDAIRPRLVLGDNISQTAQFATSGSAQGGIIALSLARASAVAQLGKFALIPGSWHQPLRQRMVLTTKASAPVRAFYDYIATPQAQSIMGQYGFVIPKDRPQPPHERLL
ncbi:molybdate ABC transporter substrate-binding protein [Mesorhizobium sp. ANAO-SY3R2]|uniref:molybdate ABC transporter substrate-binding protein n=1 Tax=Pseudomonadota TaxID=1224 RepID=UPI0036724BCD